MAAELTARAAYARALDPECLLPGGEFVRELRVLLAGQADPDRSLPELRLGAAAWAQAERESFLAISGKAANDGDRANLVRRALLGCAPLALRSGAWLQWLTGMDRAEDPAWLRALALYAADVGAGHPHSSRAASYLAILRELRLAKHASSAANLVLDQRIADAAFVLPAVLLLAGRRPAEFDAEIIGADLCLRTVGLLPALAVPRETVAASWSDIDPATARGDGAEGGGGGDGRASGLELAESIVEALPDAAADRVRLGFRWTFAALRGWNDQLRAELAATLDPAFDMAELMCMRAREGAVYHQKLDLGGQPLAELLRTAHTDPGPLLTALAASRYVKPGAADRSALVNGLISERGPMFRVFAPEDLGIIRRWIDGLPQASAPPPPPRPAATATLELPSIDDLTPGTEPSGLRDAYHRLLSRSDTPALRAWAKKYVHGWLARSAYRIERGEPALPAQSSARGLRPWLAEQHDRHDREFGATANQPAPSREDLIESTVQTAPLTLIDGAWLQGFADYELAASDLGFSMFEIYWDELGNGEPRLNHPLIYREVLAEMDASPPPTASPEFARWDRFDEESFELPVYWLCLGRFPRTFLAEILGMNLAMELSGVGGTYRRARIALREHGFSTRFVDIHNTIDNVASGHSAWAADAIDTYLSALPPERVGPAWARVRTGFRSLNPPDGRGARRAQRRATRQAAQQPRR